MAQFHLSFGGNLGEVSETFERAVDLLAIGGVANILLRSLNYRTLPMGEEAGATFLNAVMKWETTHTPLELLRRIHEVEAELGRVRGKRWGPRPIDIDILSWDGDQIDEPDLMIPHPHCWLRRFVLDPWAEISPDWIHPEFHESVRQRGETLKARPLHVVLTNRDPKWRTTVSEQLRTAYPAAELEVTAQDTIVPARSSGSEVTRDVTATDDARRCVAVTFTTAGKVDHSSPHAVLPSEAQEAGRRAVEILGAILDRPVPVNAE